MLTQRESKLAAFADEQTPCGNTGLECQDFQGVPYNYVEPMLDWIQGVALVTDVKAFVEFVMSSTGGVPIWKAGQGRFKGRQWQNACDSTCKTQFLWNMTEGGFSRVWFSVPGSACRRMGLRDSVRLIMGLFCRWKAGFTRIDAKVRVSAALLTPQMCYDQAIAGNITGIRGKESVSETTSYDSKGRASTTVYLGATGSDCRTRIYDPFVKHGVEGFTDIEAVLCDDKAQALARILSDLPNGFDIQLAAQIIAGAAVGQVSFIDRSSGERASRCPKLPFWQKLVDFCGGALKIRVPAEDKTFAKIFKWLDYQVFPTMAGLGQAFGMPVFFKWLRDKVGEAADRISPELMALVEQAKRDALDFETVVKWAVAPS